MLMEAAKIHKYGMGFVVFYVDDHFDPRLLYGRQFVIQELTYWQDCWKRERSGGLSDFALRWRDDKDRWDLQIQYHGLLFAAIALQLMLVVANADSLYCCSGCGTPYIRAFDVKRPKRGCDNYCEDCRGKGIAQRNANARRRARVAAQG